MEHLAFHAVVIPDTFNGGVDRLAGLQIEANRVALSLLILQE